MSKENKFKTSINDLPNELLSRIFSYISLNADLDNVQQVSKRWYAVVDETIGREITISSLTTDNETILVSKYPCHVLPGNFSALGCLGFDQISKIGIQTCHVDLPLPIRDISISTDKGNKYDVDSISSVPKNLTLKYPHLLNNLYFLCSIRSDLFHCLLKETENLTMLKINLFALSQLIPSDLESLALPHLKSLVVGKCLKATGMRFNDAWSLPNLQVLLEKNAFPKLGELDLRFPIQDFRDFKTIQAILKFLAVHATLKELYMIMEFPVQVNVVHHFQDELKELLTLAKKHANRRSLKICEIQGIRIHASYPQIQVWQGFLEQQESLKSLTLRIGYLPATFLDTICTKNKSLEHLFLYKLNEIMDNDPGAVVTILDSRVFSSAKLYTLNALGCDLISNIKSLPRSLSTLFLSGIISSTEVEHILFDLPELQFVNLKNACLGKQEGFGVNLDILRRFIETRKVKRLILNGSSLSDDYPAEGLSNGNPNNPVQLMEFDNWDEEHIYLDWELNKDMYYVDKCYGLLSKFSN